MRYFLSALPKGPTLQIKPRQAHIGPNGADNHFMVCHFVDGRHGLKSPCLSCNSVHHTDNLQKATSADAIIGQVALIQCRPKTRFAHRAAPGHSLGDARLRDLKPELEQFAVDARRAPKRIFDAHPPDQCAQLRVDLRSPSLWARLPTPVGAKAGPVPTHKRLGPDDCENLQD
jgi:hypothetical protein